MKTEMTTQQAITMYSMIEALSNQFADDNIRLGRPHLSFICACRRSSTCG